MSTTAESMPSSASKYPKAMPTMSVPSTDVTSELAARKHTGLQSVRVVSIAGDYDLNKTLFTDTKVGDLIVNKLIFKDKQCISIDCDTPVNKALALMVSHGIHALPVKYQDRFQGILNLSDIIAHLSGYKPGPKVSEDTTTETHGHHEAVSMDPNALNFPCCNLLGLTWESRQLVVLYENEKLDSVVPKLASGIHRALVCGEGWWQVISQWDFAVWLARHHNLNDPQIVGDRSRWLGTVVNGTLEELGLAESKHIATLPTNTRTIEGFRQIVEHGVSAMPVVDNNGKLVGTLSTSDLLGMDEAKLKSLTLPIIEFLETYHLAKAQQVTAMKDKKFGEVLVRLQVRDVHRIWLIDNENKPIGVVSLTDILRKLAQWFNLPPKSLTDESSSMHPDTGKAMHTKGSAAEAASTCSYGNKGCTCGQSCLCRSGMESGKCPCVDTHEKSKRNLK